ncbi:hypothetical protein V2S66_12035 [Streptomyces sp. V4-01]|uniref:Spore-associated protein A n=1 Tax=Actinacidiphila polyblastidii TaxID=3110430 RepID=A0ABU7PA81_9ACTN|nr:hypothetical protein [Streptomyces sp. V4-01]
MKKKIAAVVTAAAAVVAGSILVAPGADASGYGCSGTEIGTYAVRVSGGTTSYGTAHLYYDSATGDNCAVNVATAAGGYGSPHEISVYLSACKETSPNPTTCTPTGTAGSDDKTYDYYAGPVRVHAPGKCIYLYATDTFDWNFADYFSGAFHCG